MRCNQKELTSRPTHLRSFSYNRAYLTPFHSVQISSRNVANTQNVIYNIWLDILRKNLILEGIYRRTICKNKVLKIEDLIANLRFANSQMEHGKMEHFPCHESKIRMHLRMQLKP